VGAIGRDNRLLMKTCTVCKEEKPFTEYHKRKAMKDGHRSACKACERHRIDTSYKEAYKKSYTRVNRARGHRPLEEYLEEKRRNPIPRSVRTARRRAMKKKANASWANKEYIKDLYANAQEANAIFESIGLTPNFQIDHIIPLQNDLVCGLHVEHNLQVLPAEENQKKSNKFEVV